MLSSKYPKATWNFSSNSSFLDLISADLVDLSVKYLEESEEDLISSADSPIFISKGMLMCWPAGYSNFLPWMVYCLFMLFPLSLSLAWLFLASFLGSLLIVSGLILELIALWTSI